MPSLPSGEDILNQFQWRYATKLFDAEKRISDADWHILSETLRLAPSSYGLQPWRFIVVESPDLRKKLAQAAPLNKAKFEGASHIVVLAGLKNISDEYVARHFDRIAAVRNVPRESLQGHRDMVRGRLGLHAVPGSEFLHWTSLQIYLAMGAFLTVAAQLCIDTCAMEGIAPEAFDDILGLTGTGYHTVVALAAGYRSVDDVNQHAAKVRFERQDVLITV